MKLGFTRSEADPNLYFKVEDDKPLILVLYVDDLVLTGADPLIHKFNTLSQRMVEPHHIHWIGAENLLRYLHGTITYGLRYTAEDVRLIGYTYADWAGNVVDPKSTSVCCFSLEFASISWMSKKQNSAALSTIEVEYIAASMTSCEALWLQKLFNELFGFTLDTTVILCDNQSGICLLENLVFHDRSKHINIRYHYIRDMVQQGAIRLQHIDTDQQVADILTKPRGKDKFLTFRERFGVVQRPSDEGPV
eukprot:PITA_08121